MPFDDDALAKNRFQVRTYTTPLPEDLFFFEVNDWKVPGNREGQWTYGQPHWDPVRFPNHELVFVTPADQHGNQYWYYAAKRENQDQYNFEATIADIGGQKFSAVRRTYIIKRNEFDPGTPAMGATMPDIPTGKFGASGFVMALREQSRIQDEKLDSLYVVDVRTYVKRVTITDAIQADMELGIGVGTTRTLYYRGESVSGTAIEARFADPTSSYWGIQSDGTIREGQQISDNWFAVTVRSSRNAALLAYNLKLPTTANLDLPDVLLSAEATWNKSGGTGTFNSEWQGISTWQPSNDVNFSLSGSESASAESSASIQPSLVLDIKSPVGKNLPSTSLSFFMQTATLDATTFLAKVSTIMGGSVSRWPVFSPVAHTITLKGAKVAVSAKASGSASASARGDAGTGDGSIMRDKNDGSGSSCDVATMSETLRIPPTIHGEITISGTLSDSATAEASCKVGWDSYSTGQYIAGQECKIFGVTADSGTVSLDAEGSIYPSTLAATTPSEIPSSGLYLIDSKITPYQSGWVQCFAEVIDATVIP
jgi:hypothetical protein